MNKEVDIKITGIQTDGNDTGEVTAKVAGQYFFKNNKHYILYDEYLEENNPDSLNKNTITIHNRNDKLCANLIKKGYQNSHLTFIVGEKYATSYHTPYGTFLMVVDTTYMDVHVDDDNIYLEIKYDLHMNDEFISHNNIKIEIQNNIN